LHDDVHTIMGPGLRQYATAPALESGKLVWQAPPKESGDAGILSTVDKPFSADGGLRLLQGNLGRAVIKVSAVKLEHRKVRAPAKVFESQDAFLKAARAGVLNDQDFIAVLRFQGPKAIGMPELHQLTPTLANFQDKGFKVALVTDGRMSGASGKVPAAIHVSPEAAAGGALARVHDGDMVELDSDAGVLRIEVDEKVLAQRTPATFDIEQPQYGMGRDLFGNLRAGVTIAEEGASFLTLED
jgi:phosphogluconate dehydratase